MNYIIFQDIKTIIKILIKNLKTEVCQRIIFTINKYKFWLNKKIYSTQGNQHTIHICNSSSKYREWITYSGETKLSKDINIKELNKHIKFLRVIFPYGLRSNQEIEVQLKLDNSTNNKRSINPVIHKTILIKAKDIKYLRNLYHVDIQVNKIIKEIRIKKQKTPLTLQKITNIKSKPLKTIYIILDAINYTNFINSKGYQKYLNNEKSYTYKAFAPSTVTGSSLPSLLTLQPVLTHLIGDYHQWFYSSELESLPPDLKIIAEIVKNKSEYSEAYTSFSKSMPFYNYYRGFNIYNNRCTGNNYSPSALDLLQINLLENAYLYSELTSSLFFVHDIGAHPPIFPKITISNNLNENKNSSYNYSIEIALNKINSLISELKATNQYDNTNIIITSDHTESSPDFSKERYHLFSNRIEVPIHIKPAKNCNLDKFKTLMNGEELLPSSYLLSKLFNNIYDIELNHPEYNFENIYWLSSVYKYPERKFIYTLGFDKKNRVYITAILRTELLKIKNNNLLLDEVKIYLIKDKKLLDLPIYLEETRIKKSFALYVESCRRNQNIPVKQGAQIFI